MSNTYGKMIKVMEPFKQPNTEKQINKYENKELDKLSKLCVKTATLHLSPEEYHTKMINQAIYYVANDDIKSARRILVNLGVSSWDAKCWCKEEVKCQQRDPKEKAKYYNKPMPEEFIAYMH